ncbi:acyltransferase [Aliikangiella marina]|uniref:Acyltransferase n=1 Tax=Aliikangiella marina TaxID=1712262 RepID=A0A545TCC2_9GAMM|nr:acyltransferase family protein [Aliikangiella marina]TQV74859.1 acyltransferase [Aliikangiella marina]
MANIHYRPEIDGLRAIAVMSVIVFHAGVESMSGGFIGVDVFYVISGFLITRILLKSVAEEKFSFSDFYARRIKRLLPAAMVLIVCTLIFGAFILSPNRYIELAKSAFYSNLFLANVWFMKNSGYFDLSTQIQPLVHMWSLAVEEQFYLFYPLLLVFANKIGGISGIKFLVLFILVSSFGLNLWLIDTQPDFTFYMLPTRAWELAIGAALNFLLVPKGLKWQLSAMSLLGFVMVVSSFFVINHNDAFPGILALIPALGTAFIIYGLSEQDNILKQFLSNKPMVFIGKISYSAYLWHWPIVVYYRIYVNERAFNGFEVLMLISASLLAGYWSWKYIEERYRYRQLSNKKVFRVTRWATALAILLSLGIYLSNGMAFRMSESQLVVADDDLMWDINCTESMKPFKELDESFCVVGVPWQEAKTKAIIWGDSHSQHWAQIFDLQAKSKNMSVLIGPRKCPAYLEGNIVKSHYPRYPTFTEDCTTRNQVVLEWLDQNPEVDLIVLAAAWSGHARMSYSDSQPDNLNSLPLEDKSSDLGVKAIEPAFALLLDKLSERSVMLLADIPRPNKVLNECAFSENTWLLRSRCKDSDYKILNADTILDWHKATDQLLNDLASRYPNTTAIIPTAALCDEKSCETYINNELIYKDANHIRRNLKPDSALALAKVIGIESYLESFNSGN